MAIKAGSARRDVNCEIGDDLCGQLHRRICEAIRDDLEANLLYLTDGREQVLIGSLDLPGLSTSSIRDAIGGKTGIPSRCVILCSTHTHEGPDTLGLLHDSPVNEAYLEKLERALVEAACEAVAGARPAHVGWALGEAHVGHNRRVCWADGRHTMYGDTKRPDFTGLEGPSDPSHAVLFALDRQGRCIGIMHNNSCHATCMEGALFASADFPGEARQLLRGALGSELPVLYLQGASGDTSPWNLVGERPLYSGEQRAKEIGAALAAETLRLLHQAQTSDSPLLRHAFEEVEVGVRLPSEDALARAREIQAQGEEADRHEYVLAVRGVLRLYEQFKDRPVDTLPVHALRVGDFALAANPCELYCQFGLDIKRRSPAAVTAVAQLADGYVGYCPTIPGLMGGGYSGEAIHWCRLEPYAGYKLVDVSARLLRHLWQDA